MFFVELESPFINWFQSDINLLKLKGFVTFGILTSCLQELPKIPKHENMNPATLLHAHDINTNYDYALIEDNPARVSERIFHS